MQHEDELVIRVKVERVRGDEQTKLLEQRIDELEMALGRAHHAEMAHLNRIERLLLAHSGHAPRVPASISIEVSGPFRE